MKKKKTSAGSPWHVIPHVQEGEAEEDDSAGAGGGRLRRARAAAARGRGCSNLCALGAPLPLFI